MRRWSTKVVVGTDGSPGAEAAVDWAAAEASRSGCPLEVLAAVEPDWIALAPGVAAVPTPTASALPHYVGTSVERVRTRWPDLEVEGRHAAGHAAPVLIAASREADLVVVGARGRSLAAEVLLGSVSRHVAGHAYCPVVVVHATIGHSARPVVVGVDGSESSMRAMREAADHAEAHGTSLVVVHAWRDLAYTGYGVYATPVDLSLELRASAEDLVAHQVEKLRVDHPDVDVVVRVRESHPVTALVHASHEAQLVVIGAHGRHVFPGMRLGGVTSGVLHGAACPVMVTPAG